MVCFRYISVNTLHKGDDDDDDDDNDNNNTGKVPVHAIEVYGEKDFYNLHFM
jgi:hypothetical protein